MRNGNFNWREMFSKEAIKAQFSKSSYLTKIFAFSFIGAIAIGIFWQYFNTYLTNTRASSEQVTVTVSTGKSRVALNEEFTVDILFAAPTGKKISQLDLRMTTSGVEGGEVQYNAEGYATNALAGSGSYFDTEVLKDASALTNNQQNIRLVLSSRKPVAQLSDKVIVKLKFKATKNGTVTFALDKANMEIVGPGDSATAPTSYLISDSSTISVPVAIGDAPTATNVPTSPPTATPTKIPVNVAPAPSCQVNVVADPNAPSCPAGSACGANAKCACSPNFYNCDNNWSNGCESSTKCAEGSVCTDNNSCSTGRCESNTCQTNRCGNSVCDAGQVCENNTTCKQPPQGACSDDAQCTTGYNCISGKCQTRQEPGASCTEDTECGAGQSCNNGKCMPTFCDNSANRCPSGYSCKQGACFPTACNATNTCPAGYSCQDSACIPPTCRADVPCPPGYSCNNGACEKGTTGNGACRETADCKANGECVSGSCFCKEGTFNCDRDWANGCESSTACAGSGSVTLNMKLKFNGIGVNLPPTENTMTVNVMLTNKYLQKPIEKEVIFTMVGQADRGIRTFEGQATFTNLPLGADYSVFIKGPKHIQKRICDSAPTETSDGRYVCSDGNIRIVEGANNLDFSNIYQLAGDLPVSNEQSGFVDSVDVTFIRANLGSKDPEKLKIGDLNLDGIIDAQDYALATYTLSFKYDETISAN